MNEGFSVDDLGLSPENMPDPIVDEIVETITPQPKKRVSIIIDEVAGMKNYEVVAVNGTVYQIKRGVPVDVPPEVVHVLELARLTQIEQRLNRLTGEYEDIERTASAIPWRRA